MTTRACSSSANCTSCRRPCDSRRACSAAARTPSPRVSRALLSESCRFVCVRAPRAADRPSRAPANPLAARPISSCSRLKFTAISPTSSRDWTMTGESVKSVLAASRSPAAGARTARVKSVRVPFTSWSAALDISTAEWAVIPGRISPIAIVSSATMGRPSFRRSIIFRQAYSAAPEQAKAIPISTVRMPYC